MSNFKVPLEQTGQFSALFLKYINLDESLSAFYSLPPQINSFEEQIKIKSQNFQYRSQLVEAIKKQNTGAALSQEQSANIQKLNESNCFTVTTGHQLNVATGPLYFIYKILTTIRLAEDLNQKYPANCFVPVFWMASEDHDFEEINHFYLFGKKHIWQIEAAGAVGKLPTSEISTLLDAIPDFPVWMKEAYAQSANLAVATKKIVDFLFGEYGVVVIDGDDKDLKALFYSAVKADLLKSEFGSVVRATSEQLQSLGHKAQAFVRDHNFFYLKDTIRQRIERNGDMFVVVNTNIQFDEQELLLEMEQHPERFSPNVLLRPLYQETILPNLAYIGGPGELAYWLQLKNMFISAEIPFPILFPRNFITVLSANVVQKLEEVDLKIVDLFLTESLFQQKLMAKLEVEKFDFHKEEQTLSVFKQSLLEKATRADKSLLQAVEAEMARMSRSVEDLYKKLDKALENRHQSDFNKFQNIRKRLSPEGELQERHDNFLNFYINHPEFIKKVHAQLDPFDFRMNTLLL